MPDSAADEDDDDEVVFIAGKELERSDCYHICNVVDVCVDVCKVTPGSRYKLQVGQCPMLSEGVTHKFPELSRLRLTFSAISCLVFKW